MVWLYVPEECLDLSIPSRKLFPHIEPFVLLRGKPLPFNILSKKWKKGGWITRLYGLTLSPSTANLGVEKWILSLQVSHVSRSQVLEKNWGKMISETCGPTSPELLGKCDQNSYSLKMFQTSLTGDLIQLSLTSIKWGLIVHGVLYRLQALEPPTKEKDGSFWECPTPTASDGERTNLTHKKGNNFTLRGWVMNKENMSQPIGKLNPQWIAWLMGLPIGWINSDYWETE